MDSDFAHRLTAQSTLAELPAWGDSLDLGRPGQVLGDLLRAKPSLPGVVVTDGSEVRGALSRGQYLRLIGRHLGLELYHPRPLRRMFEAVEQLEAPLIVADSTPIQEAVRQALRRPRALLYEPLLVERRIGPAAQRLALVDFQDLLMADSRVSALRNRQMGQILSTVQEGFLLVDREHRIAAEYSKSVEAIFEIGLVAGRAFRGFLSERLSAEHAELGGDYLDTLFDPNVIEDLVVQINPLLRVRATMPDGSRRHLEFQFRRSLEERGARQVIDRVLVRVEDVTRQVQLAAELEEQEKKAQRRVAVVFDLVQADAAQVAGFLGSLGGALAAASHLLAPGTATGRRKEDVDAVFRRIHGLKGEAGMIGLRTIQSHLHRFEDGLVALRQGTDGDRTGLRGDLGELQAFASESATLLESFRRMTTAPADGSSPTGSAEPTSLPVPDEGLFSAIARLVDEMADRLGKPARFLTHTTEADVPAEYVPLLRQVLIQLARNSLVHGVETPEERRRLGKPTVATLQLALYHHAATGQLEFVFQDDGAGLDVTAIRRRAQQLGLEIDEDQPELAIFAGGFSTAGVSTLDAGRGIGMDLVRELVTEQGGVVIPHTRRGEYCAFQILVPIPVAASAHTLAAASA